MNLDVVEVGNFRLIDSQANPEISRLVSRYWRRADRQAVHSREPEDDLTRCAPMVRRERTHMAWAVFTEDYQFHGVFGMYDMDIEATDGFWTVEAKCAPHLPNHGSDEWWWEMTLFLKHFLHHLIPIPGGRYLDLVGWQFGGTGDPLHEWTMEYCAPMIPFMTNGEPVEVEVENGNLRSLTL